MNTPAPFVLRPRALELLEVLTVGLPFCAFKVVCGLFALRYPGVGALGWALIGLGLADALLNLANALSVATVGGRRLPVCCLHLAGKALGRSERGGNVGTALDCVLSFTLVAAMVAAGVLPSLTSPWSAAWNGAVVLNVLGAGALRLAQALAQEEARTER